MSEVVLKLDATINHPVMEAVYLMVSVVYVTRFFCACNVKNGGRGKGGDALCLCTLSDLEREDETLADRLRTRATLSFPGTNEGHDSYALGRVRTLALNDRHVRIVTAVAMSIRIAILAAAAWLIVASAVLGGAQFTAFWR